MKKITRETWQCEVCLSEYDNKIDARLCEAKTTEEQKFKIGDSVTNLHKRTCEFTGFDYRFEGKVVKIKVESPDEEYERKWLQSQTTERLRIHVLVYFVSFQCPYCQETREVAYYGPELMVPYGAVKPAL